jgi:hypothetical protein
VYSRVYGGSWNEEQRGMMVKKAELYNSSDSGNLNKSANIKNAGRMDVGRQNWKDAGR